MWTENVLCFLIFFIFLHFIFFRNFSCRIGHRGTCEDGPCVIAEEVGHASAVQYCFATSDSAAGEVWVAIYNLW